MAPSITLERGDITRVSCDAIVNAANPKMLGGGGVDGAIHRAAGPELLAACRRVPKVNGIRCPFGEARITPAFGLDARWVIHAVGPIYARSKDPEGVLARAYASALELAAAHEVAELACPALSTGAYGFPLDPAARIALETVASRDWGCVARVRFVLFTAEVMAAFAKFRDLPG